MWGGVSRPGNSPSASELQDVLRAGRTGRADWQAVCDEATAAPPLNDQWQVVCANLRVGDRPPT